MVWLPYERVISVKKNLSIQYTSCFERFQAGEFDEKTPYTGTSSDVIECDEHVEIAEKTAEESWVLLKNDNNTLPLGNSVKKAVVVGKYGKHTCFGRLFKYTDKNGYAYSRYYDRTR